jgi:hypothetical protein
MVNGFEDQNTIGIFIGRLPQGTTEVMSVSETENIMNHTLEDVEGV